MRVTRIETQKKNPGRKSIYADGAYVAGVSDETLLRAGLRTGDEITDEGLKALIREEETSAARRIALRFLAHRPRTRKEVRDKLREREFAESDIEKTLEDLGRAGLLNDSEFARMYIRDALAARPTGRNLIKRKLLLLGVEKATVDAALQESFAGIDDEAAALEAGRKFLERSLATRKASDGAGVHNRLAGFLSRRGFSWDVIGAVIKSLIKDQEE